jgi:DNA-binding NtrC family response regulator
MMRILVVDDERSARSTLSRLLNQCSGVVISEADSYESALQAVQANSFEAAFVDLKLGPEADNRDGLRLVDQLRTQHQTATIIVSGWRDMENIRAAMAMGAYAYVVKDELRPELVLPIVKELRERRALEQEVVVLRARTHAHMPELVGTSSAMQRLRDSIGRVALSTRPALILGPTGSGKELVVSALHSQGPNPGQPLVDVNCGALPSALIESQLFGHERGAFTGADRAHDGFFTTVGQGTLFLDEIAELPIELQAKLLRVLESGTYRPVGSQRVLQFRGRLVAATHADLFARVQDGQFREDLYYRINVLELVVPCLENRREDIPLLVGHFARGQAPPLRFTQDALALLKESAWPGNVRQLRNCIDRIAVFATTGEIDADCVLANMRVERPSASLLSQLAQQVLDMEDDEDKLQLVEQTLVAEALRRANGNKSVAARLLGVHRKVIERRHRATDL